MQLYGLIGYPLGHSFSERFFAEKFETEHIDDVSYHNFPIPSITDLPAVLAAHPELCGFNVTIPYKEQIIPYLQELDSEASAIGAVNCVSIRDGHLTGHNTDAYGFRRSLLKMLGAARPSALVLGTGGASKAVCHVLTQLGIPYQMVSRTASQDKITYDALTEQMVASHHLIVNTTPLGTFPNVDTSPSIPYDALTPAHYLFDLVYNPALTAFLRQGQQRGAAVQNGYEMLVGQAIRSWEIWQSDRD